MKKASVIVCLLLFVFLLPLSAHAADTAPPVPILYTYYRQVGWGDRIEIGYVDSRGDLWELYGYDSDLHWPYAAEAQIQYLQGKEFEKAGHIDFDDLFDLKSLVYAVEEFDGPSHPVAEDAGTERAYAVRYDKDGTAEPILLGMSGDDMFENPDPNAQGLYLAVHSLFPKVTRYGDSMGPSGFQPVGIAEFCGLGDLNNASVKAFYMDCESGPREIELSLKDQSQILEDVRHGVVTGKVSAIATTGGFKDYYFFRGDENLGRISIYDGLLYYSDGMYSMERLSP